MMQGDSAVSTATGTPGDAELGINEPQGSKRDQDHRRVAACLGCRRSKVKCEKGPDDSRCRKCIQLRSTCERPAFHVGRRKGVKNKRTGLDKALYQVEEALRQIRPHPYGLSASKAVSELKLLLHASSRRQTQTAESHGRRQCVTASSDAQDSSSEGGDNPDSSIVETSHHLESFPVLSSEVREESLAVDDAENPLQLLARASDIHHSQPLGKNTGPCTSASAASQDSPSDLSGELREYFTLAEFARDTELDMDPVYLGLVSEGETDTLFDFFHQNLAHTRWGLDPTLYTASFTRSRSAFLFTSILAASTLFIPSAAALSRRLINHCRALANRVIINRYRSVEIVLAFMVNVPWMFPSKHSTNDETSWYVSVATTIAIDLSLHKTLMPLETLDDGQPLNISRGDCIDPKAALAMDGFHDVDVTSELARKLLRRRERCWIALFVLERGMCLARGRTFTLPITPSLRECDRWHISDIADKMDGHLVSVAVLRRDLDLLFSTIRSYCDGTRYVHNDGSVSAQSIQSTIDHFFQQWHDAWDHSIGVEPGTRLPPYVQILVTHTRLSIYGSVINHPTAPIEVKRFFRTAGLSSALNVMRTAIRGEGELSSMPNNTAIMVSFAACFALRLSSQVPGNPNLASSIRTLIEETADVLQRVGTVTGHRNGMSALYGKYLRYVVRKATVATESGIPPPPSVPPPLHSQVTLTLQPLGQIAPVLADPIGGQPGVEPTAWPEQFQFSTMSDDQVIEALRHVETEFDSSFGGSSWEVAGTLDWMEWPSLPELPF